MRMDAFVVIIQGALILSTTSYASAGKDPHDLPEYYCSDTPCLNEGRCIPHDPISREHAGHLPHPYDKQHIDHFTCQCTSHWTGTYCEIARGHPDVSLEYSCDDKPCLNGGNCHPVHDPIIHVPQHGAPHPYDKPHIDHFTCQCTSHWTGEHCEIALPEFHCSDTSCLNGGRCLPHGPIRHDHPEHGVPHPYDKPHIDHFTCQCTSHWTGAHCETGLQIVQPVPILGNHTDAHVGRCALNPCIIDGTCALPGHQLDHMYTCRCMDNHTALECNAATGTCFHYDCYHGGHCTSDNDRVYCQGCHDPWHGDDCGTAPKCDQLSCMHGDCIHHGHDARCHCSHGWTGYNCDIALHIVPTNAPHGGYTTAPHIVPTNAPYGGYTTDIDECTVNTTCQNGGTCVNSPGHFNCHCANGWTDKHCQTDIDECSHTNPCQNGGTCTNTPGHYTCTCDQGWTGAVCHNDINECEVNTTCENGGTCVNKPGHFHCHCANGWTDTHCQTDIDECSVYTTCLNGGTCINLPGHFNCHCANGWTDIQCQTDINECSLTTICQNGGRCSRLHGHSMCNCAKGWTGDHCQTDVDECSLSNPCQNGGNCTNTLGHYTCICDKGWTGENCQTDVNECAHNKPCLQGGNCTNTPGHYTCTCDAGWTGDHCQTDMLPKCNHTCSLDAVILSTPVVKGTTDCSGTSSHASNEALPQVCCSMRAHADWQHGVPVQDNDACIDGKIPPYTPIAAVNGTHLINAGIFYGCIRNGTPGFMMIHQDCTSSPQLMHVDSTSDPKPDNYYVIY